MSSFIYDQINRPFGLDIITPDNPGAANNLSVISEDEYLFRLLSISFTFETDVNAANRSVRIFASIGGSIVSNAQSIGVQVASKKWHYSWSYLGHSTHLLFATIYSLSKLGEDWNFPGPCRIFSVIDNIQTGDVITDIVLYLKRWQYK